MEERLDFDVDINVDARKVGPAANAVDDLTTKLYRSGKALEAFERVHKDSQGRWRDAKGRFLGAGQGIDEFGNKVSGASAKMSAASGKIVQLASALSVLKTGLGLASGAYGLFEKGSEYAIKAMGERSATIRGYTQLLGGDKKQANLEYYRAQQFSQKTDFTSETIEKSQARLMAQGFRGKDLYATLFSAADLAAIMPGDKNQTLERVTMAMSQIKAKGRLQGEELTQQLAESGLNTTLVKQQLMKSLGLKSTLEVDRKMGKGEISADVALPAIQRAILQQLGTSKAGEYATSASGSLTGLVSNRDEAMQNLLKGFDGDQNLPAMERYKKALTEQGKLFDINTRTGKGLSLVVQDMANAALDAKGAWTEFQSGFLESFAGSYAKELNTGGRNFDTEATTVAVRNLGEAIGRLGSVAAQAIGGTGGLTAVLAQRGANVANGLAEFGGKLQSGNYGGALKDIGSAYLNNTLAPAVLGATPVGRGLKTLYDRYGHADNMPNKEDFDMTGAFASRAKIPGVIPQVSKKEIEAEKKAAAAAKKSSQEYRGVFWGYDYNGQSMGQWAQPTLGDMMKGTHTTAAALTTAINGRMPDQTVQIIIQGYGKDKMELARTIATELSRVARSPR